MSYPTDLVTNAVNLRRQGFSYLEISNNLHIAKATAYCWTKDVRLSREAKSILEQKMTLAQIKATESNTQKRRNILNQIKNEVDVMFNSFNSDSIMCKITASLLYWAEGAKTSQSCLCFMNSDPKMISTFMFTLRGGFNIDESKFRGLVHVHEYHDEAKTKEFWSEITQIPLSQFNKSYLKPNTGKRIHQNYNGCLSIRYYDYKIAAELRMIYNKLPAQLGVW